MLNNKGPNMEPCGTPKIISSQELKVELAPVLYLRFDK